MTAYLAASDQFESASPSSLGKKGSKKFTPHLNNVSVSPIVCIEELEIFLGWDQKTQEGTKMEINTLGYIWKERTSC